MTQLNEESDEEEAGNAMKIKGKYEKNYFHY